MGEGGNYARQVEALLREYESLAKGKINLHLINPTPFSEEEYKARLFGLDGNPAFFGLIGTLAGHGAQRIESFSKDREPLLEYEISHLIHKVAHPEQPVIGVLSALPMDGEKDKKGQTLTPPWQVLQALRGHFNLVTLGPQVEHIPAHVKTLLLVDPGRLPDQALYAVDQFVLGGGKVMMFIDPQAERATAPATPSTLDGLLTAWGIHMPGRQVLADATYASTAVIHPGQAAVRHPAALTLPRAAMAQHDPATLKLHTVTVLSSGALAPLKRARTTFTPLLQSSGQAALFDATRFADAHTFGALLAEVATRDQPQVIAARLEGPAYSAFPDGLDGAKTGLQKAANIQVVVVADTDLLSDRVGAAAAGNTTFVLNTLDNLAAPHALANLRARPSNPGPPGRQQALRDAAERAYRGQVGELEQRLAQTEQEWQRLNPPTVATATQAVTSHPLLQALNKERLRLPMEIHALRQQAYGEVHALDRQVKQLTVFPVPLMLCLIALGIAQVRRRRRGGLRALY
ncbi:Gldg family protein [Pseudomonas sp. SDO528_S397]